MPEGNFFFQRLPVQRGPDASFERVISGIAEGQKRLWRVLFPGEEPVPSSPVFGTNETKVCEEKARDPCVGREVGRRVL